MSLLDTLSEIEKSICNKKKESKEYRMLRVMKEHVKQKDFKYWQQRVKQMNHIDDIDHNTAEYEYFRDKEITEYLRDVLVYDTYLAIINEPEKMKELLEKMKIEKQEHDKFLESLERIMQELQLRIKPDVYI